MIAVDTNVVLRYLLGDDEAQAALSRRIIEAGDRVLITDVVLVECLWTLSGRKYKATKADLVSVVVALLAEPNVCFENDEIISLALDAYRKLHVDFADALIVHKAMKSGSAHDPVTEFFTFDVNALQLPKAVKPC